MIALKEIKDIPKNAFEDTNISDVYVKHKKHWEISSEEEAIKALETMIKEGTGRIIVKEEDKIIGLITRNGITKYLQIMAK